MEAISIPLSLPNSDVVSESERREVVLGGDKCSAVEAIIDVSVSMYKLDFRYKLELCVTLHMFLQYSYICKSLTQLTSHVR